MSEFISKIVNNVEIARNRRLEGRINSIYWGFDRLTDEKMFPGWIKGKYYAISASTSVKY